MAFGKRMDTDPKIRDREQMRIPWCSLCLGGKHSRVNADSADFLDLGDRIWAVPVAWVLS